MNDIQVTADSRRCPEIAVHICVLGNVTLICFELWVFRVKRAVCFHCPSSSCSDIFFCTLRLVALFGY